MEVALLSELEFKHQVTTARGGGREAGEGGHESTEVPGCPEDRKRDGGRAGRGVMASGMGGPIRTGCLGRRRRKRVKGQAGRESGTLLMFMNVSFSPACSFENKQAQDRAIVI